MKKEKKLTLDAPVKFVCNHIVGENHKPIHREICGVAVMVLGVSIATASHCLPYKALEMAGDMVGYLIHAMGAVPVLKKYVG
jgi:hypothetical protein